MGALVEQVQVEITWDLGDNTSIGHPARLWCAAVRVLMLTWELPPASTGGMAAHVDGLAHGLSDMGHEVVVITRRSAGTDRDVNIAGVRVLRADIDLPWLPDRAIARVASGNHAFVAIADSLGDWRPDVVHAHDWQVAWAAQVLSGRHQAPIITTFHGTERSRHGGHVPPGVPTDVNGIEWWLAANSRRVITITRLLARQVTTDFELDPAAVRSIPGGIDPSWWAAPDPDLDESPRTDLVFSWGRVQFEKGFQVLAAAMGTVRSRLPEARCEIAGRGTYLADLQSRIDVIGVSDVVDLVGFLSDNELRAAIHRAACVVLPSLYEPFGVIGLEALAGGAPLVISETGGLAELVEGTGAAQTFEPGNAEELADRICEILENPDRAAEMRTEARALVESTYSWAAIAQRTEAWYLDALSR